MARHEREGEKNMKRSILITAIGLILTVGSGSLYAGGTCPSCKGREVVISAEVSSWQLFVLLLPTIFGAT